MNTKDTIIIKDYPLATIEFITPKAVCVSYEGLNSKCNTWLPKKLITIDSSKDIIRNYRNIKEYNISLPAWFLNTNKMRLILIPIN